MSKIDEAVNEHRLSELHQSIDSIVNLVRQEAGFPTAVSIRRDTRGNLAVTYTTRVYLRSRAEQLRDSEQVRGK